jgi:phytoene dehydrogenase-like protein
VPDVIVVGAGHNGLVAACYLARAGRDVLVVEAADAIGGCTTTAPIPGAPGYYANPCAFDVIALRLSTIGRDLELARHGYTEVAVDPCYVALGPSGESLAYWRDPRRTAAEIRRFSARDERAFLDLMRELDHVADAMLPMMLTNPTRPDRSALAAVLKAAGRHPKSFGPLIGLLIGSAAQALRERFEHPVVRGTFAMLANFGSPVSTDGSGVNLMVLPLISRAGMSRPVGGLGALVDALAADLREHGGRWRTSATRSVMRAAAGCRTRCRWSTSSPRPRTRAVHPRAATCCRCGAVGHRTTHRRAGTACASRSPMLSWSVSASTTAASRSTP